MLNNNEIDYKRVSSLCKTFCQCVMIHKHNVTYEDCLETSLAYLKLSDILEAKVLRQKNTLCKLVSEDFTIEILMGPDPEAKKTKEFTIENLDVCQTTLK